MCGCTDNTNPCQSQECGCKFEVDAGCVRYTGDDLSNIDVITGDTVHVALEKINELFSTVSPGDYITTDTESAGSNCTYGGVRFELRDGLTGLVKSTNYICNLNPSSVAGSGTTNFISKWTPDGTQLGDSLLQDDGDSIGIGTTPKTNVYLDIVPVGRPIGGRIVNNNDSVSTTYGWQAEALGSNEENIAGKFTASGVNPYALELVDGTEGTGKFLKSVTSGGKANWASLTEADITDLGTYTPKGTLTDQFLPLWDDTGSELIDSPISYNGSTTDITTDIYVNSLLVGRGSGNISSNTVLGNTFVNNTTGYNNTAIGYNTLISNTTANNNTAIGMSSLYTNSTGGNNTALGFEAAYYANTFSLTAVGYQAAKNSTVSVTALGSQAALNNTTGTNNLALGFQALLANTTSSGNTGVGYRSLYNTTGGNNTAVGNTTLFSNTTGGNNTANGNSSLYFNTTGSNNSALGINALLNNTTGSNNDGFGVYSLGGITIGSNNVGLGYYSGYYLADGVTSNQNPAQSVYVGADTKSFAASQTNEIVIGYNTTGNGTNTVTLGNNSITKTYIKGDISLPTSTAVTTAAVTQTKHIPIEVNGVTYKLLLAD